MALVALLLATHYISSTLKRIHRSSLLGLRSCTVAFLPLILNNQSFQELGRDSQRTFDWRIRVGCPGLRLIAIHCKRNPWIFSQTTLTSVQNVIDYVCLPSFVVNKEPLSAFLIVPAILSAFPFLIGAYCRTSVPSNWFLMMSGIREAVQQHSFSELTYYDGPNMNSIKLSINERTSFEVSHALTRPADQAVGVLMLKGYISIYLILRAAIQQCLLKTCRVFSSTGALV